MHESLSVRLRTQLDAVSRILAGVSSEALSRCPSSGEWCARENLAHLGRHHEVFLERLERILSENKPALGRYRAEDDPDWPQWQERSTDDVLERLRFLRSKIVTLIQGLSSEELARVGVHPLFGEMAIPLWTEFFLLHEAHHLYTAMIRAHGG